MSHERAIGGVTYIPVESPTLRHDNWLLGRIHKAGLAEVVLRPGEGSEEWAKRFMFELAANDAALLVVAGLLVPKGERWTPAVARATAAALGDVTAIEEKEVVMAYLLQALAGFFESGLTSFWSTKTS